MREPAPAAEGYRDIGMFISLLPVLLDTNLAPTNKNINFDDLFPRLSWYGKSARNQSWSPSERYLAYLWNPYDDPGSDIWLYDKQTGKSSRLTSMEVMKQFDRSVAAAIAQDSRDRDFRSKVLGMSDEEYRKVTQERKVEAEKKPTPRYGGISDVTWAHKSDEFMFTYKGDIFRWKVGEKSPMRITKTQGAESGVTYTNDDKGFYFMRDGSIIRMMFDSPVTVQINPRLPNRAQLQGYWLSPDEKKMAILGSVSKGEARQVDYLSYRGRFATAAKAPRSVADDPFNDEDYIYIADMRTVTEADPEDDYKPKEIYAYKGGDDYGLVSVAGDKCWSADSKKFAYATYMRAPHDLQYFVYDAEKDATKAIYKTKSEGEENTPRFASPFWTKEGKIITLMEITGYRHIWVLDPVTEAAKQLTNGEFETYPVQVSEDGKSILAYSSKYDPARIQLYRVSMADGSMERITNGEGNYSEPVVSEKGNSIAMKFANWKERNEMFVLDGGGQKKITDSHRPGFEKANKVQPKLFTYKNRNGQTIHGYIFEPAGLKKGDKRPLMIYVYGGPLGTGYSVQDGDFNSTAYMFNQYLTVEHGYVTVCIDPRGQTGYGSAFGRANFDQPGKPQVEDLSDGVKHLVANYGVDPTKVAINGWSFGGFQTQMCMYTAPDVFTLGIAGAGPTEWQNYNNWYTGNTITRSKMGDPSAADRYSLTKLAKNLRNPLMLLHGMEDTNVLFQDTVHVYQQLLRDGKGHLVELSLDPTGGHGMGGDMSNHDRHMIYLSFIKKYWER